MRVNTTVELYGWGKREWQYAFAVEIEANEADFYYLQRRMEQTRVKVWIVESGHSG